MDRRMDEEHREMQARPRDKWPTFCDHILPTPQSPNVRGLVTNSELRDRISE